MLVAAAFINVKNILFGNIAEIAPLAPAIST